jgi:parallel beta-helix repeat protein
MTATGMRRTSPPEAALGFAVVVLLCPAGVRAGTIVVPDDRPTIRDAVAHAGPKDTIRIKPGTYAESIVIAGHGKDGLTLEGLDGRPRITPPPGTDGIRVRRARHVTIGGVDVSGGRVGVHVLDASQAVVTDVHIADTAHGIRLRRCVNDCEIGRNTVQDTTHGPGILVRDSPGVTITGNIVTRSGREGVYVSRADELSIDANVVEQSGADGIRITQCDDVDAIDSNIARANARSGLHLNHGYAHGTCAACGLTDNTAEGNRRYGFRVRRWARLASAKDLSELGNTAASNQAADLHVSP